MKSGKTGAIVDVLSAAGNSSGAKGRREREDRPSKTRPRRVARRLGPLSLLVCAVLIASLSAQRAAADPAPQNVSPTDGTQFPTGTSSVPVEVSAAAGLQILVSYTDEPPGPSGILDVVASQTTWLSPSPSNPTLYEGTLDYLGTGPLYWQPSIATGCDPDCDVYGPVNSFTIAAPPSPPEAVPIALTRPANGANFTNESVRGYEFEAKPPAGAVDIQILITDVPATTDEQGVLEDPLIDARLIHTGGQIYRYSNTCDIGDPGNDCLLDPSGSYVWQVVGSLCNSAGCTDIQSPIGAFKISYVDPESSARFHAAERLSKSAAASIARKLGVHEYDGYCDMPGSVAAWRFSCNADVTAPWDPPEWYGNDCVWSVGVTFSPRMGESTRLCHVYVSKKPEICSYLS
jgi:hypothetical protein